MYFNGYSKFQDLLTSPVQLIVKIWPYRILKRDDDGIKADLLNIINHFSAGEFTFDIIIFIPNAGIYLSNLFLEMFGNSFEIGYYTIRRASTLSADNFLKNLIFRNKHLANVMRHFEMLFRLVKNKIGIRHRRVIQGAISCNVNSKRVLVIDDSVDTGTTMELVKAALFQNGACSVKTASIANQSISSKVDLDFSVHNYVTLRTKNSRDYYAS